MRSKIFLILLLIGGSALVVVHRVSGQAGSFVIERADAANYLSLNASSFLNVLIAEVAPRPVVEHANSIRYYPLNPLPASLSELLNGIGPRFVLQYANAKQDLPLTYPKDLIDDTVPPQIVSSSMDGTKSILWITDEFTICEVQYGRESGKYTDTIKETEYSKTHQVTLAGLTEGESYYYRILATDLSGNSSLSGEHTLTFLVERNVYVPFVTR